MTVFSLGRISRGVRRRVLAAMWTASRSVVQTRDANFIGYDKYRRKGAFHWKELSDNEDYSRRVEAVASYVNSGDTCLDIGCGDGAYIYSLSGKCRRIVGMDADYDAIRVARKKLADYGVKNSTLIQAPLSKCREPLIKTGTFDVVYSMDVIEHLPEPRQLLGVAKSAVKPDGLVLIGTPLFVSADLVSPYHVKEFTVDEIRHLVAPYFSVKQEIILPTRRKDGRVYPRGFCILVGVL